MMALYASVYTAQAVEPDKVQDIPHVSAKAKEHFQQYQYAPGHKAFAIAPGGAWYWMSELESEVEAKQQTLKNCQSQTQQKCVLYALNNRIVFDADSWPGLWAPYVSNEAASKAADGVNLGQRFPDLVWSNKQGKQVSVSDLKGKLTIVHFWGSWCPPCMREFPSLKQFYAEIKKHYSADVEMVMLQLREPFNDSKQWAEQYGFTSLPLFDSGVKDTDTTELMLKDGRKIRDRTLARVFPSTYVLDRNGLVIFSHNGPVHDWLEYVAFIDHAVKATAKTNSSSH
ncbi:MAG: TlpA family protein disulfide reductase [Gammaproteobacteria bacterium]|nr:TlpA family protein disulfide reductase [Gammaproteobacteria bacterium]